MEVLLHRITKVTRPTESSTLPKVRLVQSRVIYRNTNLVPEDRSTSLTRLPDTDTAYYLPFDVTRLALSDFLMSVDLHTNHEGKIYIDVVKPWFVAATLIPQAGIRIPNIADKLNYSGNMHFGFIKPTSQMAFRVDECVRNQATRMFFSIDKAPGLRQFFLQTEFENLLGFGLVFENFAKFNAAQMAGFPYIPAPNPPDEELFNLCDILNLDPRNRDNFVKLYPDVQQPLDGIQFHYHSDDIALRYADNEDNKNPGVLPFDMGTGGRQSSVTLKTYVGYNTPKTIFLGNPNKRDLNVNNFYPTLKPLAQLSF